MRPTAARHPGCILVSTVTGEGLDKLTARLEELASARDAELTLLIPHDRYDLVARLHDAATVLESKSQDRGTRIVAIVPDRLRSAVEPYISEK